MRFAPPRGTRDFYPDDMRIRNWIFSTWRTCALAYGFEEYDGPIIESEDLYTVKSGEEIVSQLYNFTDKGGRRVAIRPEMTPTMARMIGAQGSRLPRPIKWFAIVQCFRYERMSLGRKREHYQWNLDIVGIRRVTAEAELLAVALDALQRLGIPLESIVVKVNHKGIPEALLESLEIPEEKRQHVLSIIDKQGKESEATLRDMCGALELSKGAIEEIFTLFRVSTFDMLGESIVKSQKAQAALEDLHGLFDCLGAYGIETYCRFTPTIVRGLPYYTGIVFECFDRAGKFRAIFGGGRYDRLLELFGAKDTPAVGLGFGDIVLRELLEARGCLPRLTKEVDFFIVPYSEAERSAAIQLAQALRKQGMCVDVMLETKKLKRALTDADRSGARYAVLLLPDELKDRMVRLRRMSTGVEEQIPLDAAVLAAKAMTTG